MVDILMPQMGESIAEGTVTKWLKKVGDRVQRDEPILEISTDKVDAEIPSPAAGVLREIKVDSGATVPVNAVLGVIADEAQAAAPAPQPAAAAPAPAPAPTAPAPSQPAAATVPTPPPAASAPPAAPATLKPGELSAEDLRRTRSSPVVRKIAAEHQVDIRQVQGTGISGRVTRQDILHHLEGRPAEPTAPPPPTPPPAQVPTPPPMPAARPQPPAPPAPPAPVAPPPPPAAAAPAPAPPAAPPPPPAAPGVPTPAARAQVVPMSPIRKKTAEHMVLSKRTSAHVTTVFEVDMSHVDKLRSRHKAAYEQQHFVKLTYLPFIVKAAVDALKVFPVLNSSLDGDAIAYHKDVNVGIAVALDWGLIVPVIRNADEKNILGLARSIGDLADRARTRRLKVDEVQGGTFTITNPGVFGSLFGTPIINQPQVAILAVGTIEKRPVVRDDAIAIRTMMYLALSFDHRIVDGADADRFMAHLKKALQEFDETAL
jgi:pyruvate dehydrogenase E2 component (dihydrolipoamide acetyltransferase)